MSLKQKTISALIWSFIDAVASKGIQFLVGIILARILFPREFGLIGMISIFISVSESFVNSGFKTALLRKKDCSQKDYSTAFYFNVVLGIFFYILIYLSAPRISIFFKEPEIERVLQILGVVVIIDSLTIVQKTILHKSMNFRALAKVSLFAGLISGGSSVFLAHRGFGVWSIVALRLINQIIVTSSMWVLNRWRPDLVFSIKSFKSLFNFGSKILFTSQLNNIYNNVLYIVIGKFYSASELGYFTRANQFKSMFSEELSGIVNRVSFPILVSLNDDNEQLKDKYRLLIKCVAFLSFHLMIGLAAISKSLVVVMIGERWLPSVPYLQLLCMSGLFFAVNYINSNLLQVQGNATRFMWLEVIKVSISIPFIVFGAYFGVENIVIGLFIVALVTYIINSNWSGGSIDYPFRSQMRDLFPNFCSAGFMGMVLLVLGYILVLPHWLLLLIQTLVGILIVITISEYSGLGEYHYLKRIFLDKISGKRPKVLN